jgi:uncharacterized protein YndB with AHSA1/START domain
MPAQPHNAETKLDIDRSTHTIRMTRVFDASRAAIFAMWTQPQHVTCWWDAAGGPLTICEIDLRPGGAFKFVSKGQPEMPFAGTYSEITSPDRLIFEAMGATGRVLLQDVAGKTHMVVEIQCPSAEHLDQYLKMGIHTGTAQTLDNLVAYARGRSITVDEPV